MGPVIVFDKSALQSLTVDEACWLDAFYQPVITPLFFVETLADLEKETKNGRSPEHIVGNLAEKTPPYSVLNVHHTTLCVAELLGDFIVPMDRRPVVAALPAATGGQTGTFIEPPPEMEAMNRWVEHKFMEIERQFAREWRASLSGINLESIYQEYKCTLHSMQGAKDRAVESLRANGSRLQNLQFAMESFGITNADQKSTIIGRWKSLGESPLETFAPYSFHVLTVNTFFNLAIGGDLISRERPSNKIDLAYLYYLPFCYIFTSNDSLHQRTVPCFLNANQLYLKGTDLKADLSRLDDYYSQLPDAVKERGIISFAKRPPHEGFLITQLWDRFMRSDWRDDVTRSDPAPGPDVKELLAKVEKIQKAARAPEASSPPKQTSDDADFMVVERSIPLRMGKWRLLPPEVEKEAR